MHIYGQERRRNRAHKSPLLIKWQNRNTWPDADGARDQTHSRPTMIRAGTVSGIFAICMSNLDFAAILCPAIAVILCFAASFTMCLLWFKSVYVAWLRALVRFVCCEKGYVVFCGSSLHIFSRLGFRARLLWSDVVCAQNGKSIQHKKLLLEPGRVSFFLHAWLTSFYSTAVSVCVCALTEIVHYIIDGLFLSFSHRNLLPAVARPSARYYMCRTFFVLGRFAVVPIEPAIDNSLHVSVITKSQAS